MSDTSSSSDSSSDTSSSSDSSSDTSSTSSGGSDISSSHDSSSDTSSSHDSSSETSSKSDDSSDTTGQDALSSGDAGFENGCYVYEFDPGDPSSGGWDCADASGSDPNSGDFNAEQADSDSASSALSSEGETSIDADTDDGVHDTDSEVSDTDSGSGDFGTGPTASNDDPVNSILSSESETSANSNSSDGAPNSTPTSEGESSTGADNTNGAVDAGSGPPKGGGDQVGSVGSMVPSVEEGCQIAATVGVQGFKSVPPGTYTMVSAWLGPEAVPLGMGADYVAGLLRASPAAERLLIKAVDAYCKELLKEESEKRERHNNEGPSIRRRP